MCAILAYQLCVALTLPRLLQRDPVLIEGEQMFRCIVLLDNLTTLGHGKLFFRRRPCFCLQDLVERVECVMSFEVLCEVFGRYGESYPWQRAVYLLLKLQFIFLVTCTILVQFRHL